MTTTRKDRGQVIFLIVGGMVALLSVAGLAVDIGNARQEQRWAQSISDLAVLSGAEIFANAASGSIATATRVDEARARAHQQILDNGFTDADIEGGWYPDNGSDNENRGGIQVGTFPVGGPFTPGIVAPNSVRVQLRRSVAARFSKVFGTNSISPYVSSVAGIGPGGLNACTIPFGVAPSLMYVSGVPRTVPFDITASSVSGNWGEILPPGGAHNGITDALNGVNCGISLAVGDTPSSDNGNITQINNAFNSHLGQSFVLPVSNIPSASGNFNILGFVRGTVLSSSRSGSNLTVRFRITEYVAGGGNPNPSPPPGTIGYTRYLLQ